MEIDSDTVEKLREIFEYSTFVTLSHDRKDGKIRGSHKLVHNCDIAVEVKDGVDITTKTGLSRRGWSIRCFEGG